MYIINITIHAADVPEERAEELLNAHRAWFTAQAEAGHFLIVGPYRDKPMSGVIIAQAESRDALDAILTQDAYWPSLATYEVHEFQANHIAENITDYQGK